MKKKKNKKQDIIRIDDDIIDETSKKEEILKIEEIEKKKEKRKDKEESKKRNDKSKLNILLLTICFIVIIIYTISLVLNFNFNNLDIIELIKTFSFSIITILIILILFKVNNKNLKHYIIIFTILLSIYTSFSFSYSKKEEYVLDFIGNDIIEVIEWANKNNISLIELYEYSDTIPKNHIIMQEYGINTLVTEINSFTVTISDGPNYEKEVVVPNMLGFKYDDVMAFIKTNYLNNVSVEFIESTKEKDTVIEQNGSGTLKRNSLVKFVFSYGETIEEISVKDLKNLSLLEATSYLKRYNIPYEIKYDYSNTIDKNYIITQDVINEVVTEKLTITVSLGQEIIVPDFSKMSSDEISKWAFSNNIKLQYKEVYNKEIDTGKIVEVSKFEGDKISEDDTIILTISKGSMIMPNLNNLQEFKIWANENNISLEEVYEFSDNYKNGEIIKTMPEVGSKLTENDTIIITISKGKSVTIPNLIGQSKSSIQSKCSSLKISCTFTYGGYTDSTKKDIALKQSKKSGTIVSEGSNLLITLSSGIYERVNVPSFVGQNKNQVQATCSSLGINCSFKYNNVYSNQAKDTVLNQDKSGSVIKGTNLVITLSIGPAKTYTVIIDGSLLTQGNPEQTKKTLKNKLESACPGVKFNFTFQSVNSGIGYLNPNSDVKVGANNLVQGKTYNVVINSN